jgi:hypothetical protein
LLAETSASSRTRICCSVSVGVRGQQLPGFLPGQQAHA